MDVYRVSQVFHEPFFIGAISCVFAGLNGMICRRMTVECASQVKLESLVNTGVSSQFCLKTPVEWRVCYSIAEGASTGGLLLPSFDSVPLISLVMFSRCRQIKNMHMMNTAGRYAEKPYKYAV